EPGQEFLTPRRFQGPVQNGLGFRRVGGPPRHDAQDQQAEGQQRSKEVSHRLRSLLSGITRRFVTSGCIVQMWPTTVKRFARAEKEPVRPDRCLRLPPGHSWAALEKAGPCLPLLASALHYWQAAELVVYQGQGTRHFMKITILTYTEKEGSTEAASTC